MSELPQIFVYKGRLKDGVAATYTKMHDEMPEDVLQVYRDNGFIDIRIYRADDSTEQTLVAFVEPGTDINKSLEEGMKHQCMVDWMAATDKMFAEGGAWVPLPEIFKFPS